MCPSSYHHNGFVVTHALRHIMNGYILVVKINQIVLKKPSKERNISDQIYRGDNRESTLI